MIVRVPRKVRKRAEKQFKGKVLECKKEIGQPYLFLIQK